MTKNKGLFIVLTGPSGSGKDLVMSKLLELLPEFSRVVTTTTRHIRKGEKDGVDYHFIHKDEFEKKIKDGLFIEYVKYAGSYYGTTKDEIQKVVEGNDIIWRIDTSRAAQIEELIRGSFPKDTAENVLERTLVIYLSAPEAILRRRLMDRGTTLKSIKQRLLQDQAVWKKYRNRFKDIVKNDGPIDNTLKEVVGLIKKHRQGQELS